jgi:hypothetical protein
VEKAASLKAADLTCEGLNSRDRSTMRVSRITKIRACFTVSENTIAKVGLRNVYIVIISPQEAVLSNTDSKLVSVGGKQMMISAQREIDYQGTPLETCVYFNTKADALEKGTYRLVVYIDGHEAGTTDFVLK